MILIRFILIIFLLIYLFIFIGRFLLNMMFRRFQNGNNQNENNGQTYTNDGRVYYQNSPRRKKHFKPTDGEYVDYEEIK